MSNIFDDNELNEFKKRRGSHRQIPNAEIFLANDERVQGIEDSLKRIKEDYETQDMLFDKFKEKKGFVLDLRYSGYYKDDSRSTYGIVNIPPVNGHLFLIATKERDNNFFVGKSLSDTHCYRSEDSIAEVINVFTSKNKDSLDQKLELDYNLSDHEGLAYRVLTESAHFERCVNDQKEFDKNRAWFHSPVYNKELKWESLTPTEIFFEPRDTVVPRYKAASPLYGDDLIEVYKGAVRKAVRDHNKFESAGKAYTSQGVLGFSLNMRLFSVDRYPIKGYVTKIFGFLEEQIDLDSFRE